MTLEQLVDEALGLPSDARARLADRLVESLDPVEDENLRREWAVEALRRREEVFHGQVRTVPVSEALKQVRQSVRA
jgi:hypothetical protein